MSETVVLDSQLPTVVFTALAQLCGSKANATEMGAALFTKTGERRTLTFECLKQRPPLYNLIISLR